MSGRGLELKIPPVVVVGAAVLLMWLLARTVTAFAFAMPGRRPLGVLFFVGGLAVSALGVFQFRRARTTVDPRTPSASSALVRAGIYRYTRNPMYVGFGLVLLGWAISLSNALAFLLLPAYVLYMSRFQIQPEERALGEIFGQEYADYRARVRRWL
jgi:protein-S-isoprenylcysteine O-methyltransferase Ste14